MIALKEMCSSSCYYRYPQNGSSVSHFSCFFKKKTGISCKIPVFENVLLFFPWKKHRFYLHGTNTKSLFLLTGIIQLLITLEESLFLFERLLGFAHLALGKTDLRLQLIPPCLLRKQRI